VEKESTFPSSSFKFIQGYVQKSVGFNTLSASGVTKQDENAKTKVDRLSTGIIDGLPFALQNVAK
jgi:hypothetical protein